ncbi:MAG: ATP-binding protein [Ginsengibacter sp.]
MNTTIINSVDALIADRRNIVPDDTSIALGREIDNILNMTPQKIKILHVEDVHSDRELVARALRKGNIDFERLVVDSRDKFINALKDFSPDIILSDHSLPSFNSHDAVAILNETGLKIPFILVTGNLTDEFAVDVIERGADDYIFKDRLNRLPTAIHNCLEKYRHEKERQSFVAELIRKEKYYRALVENGADAIVIINIEGKLSYVSPSIKRVLGYSEKDAIKLDLYEITHPDDRAIVSKKMAECLAKPGVSLNGQVCRRKHKNGNWIWLEETLTNMLHDPYVNGIVKNFHDISELKTVEVLLKQVHHDLEVKAEQLAASNTELELFATTASMDLQDPLRAVKGFLQLLEKKLGPDVPESNKRYIDFAMHETDRMKGMIQDMQKYSRVGNSDERIRNIDCNKLVHTLQKQLNVPISVTRTNFRVKPLPVIQAVEPEIEQLFSNLVENALKYHNNNSPEIEIGCNEQPELWQFYVKDNGIGIDPKFFTKIFIIFQRLHTGKEYEGTGIGLAICKKIVEKHGGNIWVESEAGKGATFYFTIPKQISK